MKRIKLLLILATMPEEAFEFFVAWARIFPANTGAFDAKSKECIKELENAAEEYFNSL